MQITLASLARASNQFKVYGFQDPNLADSKSLKVPPTSESQTEAAAEPTQQIPSKYELTDPDVRLMLQVRAGNAAAFEKLVAKYQSRLVALLDHMVNRTQAEDLAQEVFMRVYRAREKYVATAKFSTWLFTITHNVASNALRKLSRRKEYNLNSSPSGQALARPLDNMAKEDSQLMPARVLDQSERAQIVRLAIGNLNERQRMAILLSKFEGMSYIEIAESMGLTTQAVKSLLSRARGNLKNILTPYFELGQNVKSDENDD